MADKTVAMTRDPEQFAAPHRADVHPDEVADYAAGGWVKADPLDHDQNGKKGGAKTPKAEDAAE